MRRNVDYFNKIKIKAVEEELLCNSYALAKRIILSHNLPNTKIYSYLVRDHHEVYLEELKLISLIFPLTSDWKTGNRCKRTEKKTLKAWVNTVHDLVFNLCIFCCPCSFVGLKDNNYVWRGLLSLSLQSLSCFITAVYLNLHSFMLLQSALTDNHLNTIFTRYVQ